MVGRDETCDIVIPNPRVSRRHCVLLQNARGLQFKDLESTNGVFVNGIRAKEGILEAGERLKIANYEVLVRRDSK